MIKDILSMNARGGKGYMNERVYERKGPVKDVRSMNERDDEGSMKGRDGKIYFSSVAGFACLREGCWSGVKVRDGRVS